MPTALFRSLVVAAILGASLHARHASAQSIGPGFARSYAITSLGSPGGVPTSLGGLLILPGDTSILAIGGDAGTTDGALYVAVVTRNGAGHVEGFSGRASYFQSAEGVSGGIDAGLDVHGDVAFYVTAPDNRLGQIPSDAVGPTKLIDLTPLGVAASTGGLRFVPNGHPGAGRLKLTSSTANVWYDASVTPDGNGTFDVALSSTTVALAGGAAGIAYVPIGSAQFRAPSVLVAERTAGRITAYDVDTNGDPIASSARVFVDGVADVSGLSIDTVTNDLLISIEGESANVLRVSGFAAPSPSADLSGDGAVNGADLGILLGAWGPCAARGPCAADLNGSGAVDGADLGILLGAWTG
ncbi:MAG: hypothetical protein JNM94_02365 [Phycisphaerae bacterium]|nr:hypothetical protein [Phycisphaerae bacterium]